MNKPTSISTRKAGLRSTCPISNRMRENRRAEAAASGRGAGSTATRVGARAASFAALRSARAAALGDSAFWAKRKRHTASTIASRPSPSTIRRLPSNAPSSGGSWLFSSAAVQYRVAIALAASPNGSVHARISRVSGLSPSTAFVTR